MRPAGFARSAAVAPPVPAAARNFPRNARLSLQRPRDPAYTNDGDVLAGTRGPARADHRSVRPAREPAVLSLSRPISRRPARRAGRLASVIAIALFSLVGIGANSALAADGPHNTYGPYLGYTYANWSRVDHYVSGGMYGETFAQTTSGANAPVNYIGVQASLYRAGALCISGPMYYNSSPSNYQNTSSIRIAGPETTSRVVPQPRTAAPDLPAMPPFTQPSRPS